MYSDANIQGFLEQEEMYLLDSLFIPYFISSVLEFIILGVCEQRNPDVEVSGCCAEDFEAGVGGYGEGPWVGEVFCTEGRICGGGHGCFGFWRGNGQGCECKVLSQEVRSRCILFMRNIWDWGNYKSRVSQ